MVDIFETFIPIVAIITSMATVLAIALAIIIAAMKKRKLEIEAYKAAIDKGLPVPELKSMEKSPLGTFKASLIWIAIGIGFFFMMLAEGERSGMAFGSIPLLIGVALMISYFMEKKEKEKEKAEEKNKLT